MKPIDTPLQDDVVENAGQDGPREWMSSPKYLTRLTAVARAVFFRPKAPTANGLRPSDVLSESLMAAWSRERQFKGSTFKEFCSWFKKIVSRKISLHYRRTHRENPLSSDLLNGSALADPNLTPSSAVSRDFDLNQIARVFADLPLEQAELLHLRLIEGCSRQETADRLGISLNQLDYRYNQARDRLKASFPDGGERE